MEWDLPRGVIRLVWANKEALLLKHELRAAMRGCNDRVARRADPVVHKCSNIAPAGLTQRVP